MTDVIHRRAIRRALRHPRGLRLLRRYVDGLAPDAVHSLRRCLRLIPQTMLESSPYRGAVKEIIDGDND